MKTVKWFMHQIIISYYKTRISYNDENSEVIRKRLRFHKIKQYLLENQ